MLQHTSTESSSPATPTLAEVERIAALADPVVRNLQITQCYHELSAAMAALTGPLANWCTFATWASKQAGRSIRKEDLARTFENLLERSQRASEAMNSLAETGVEAGGPQALDVFAMREALRDALSPAAAFQRVSDAIARGNKKVFEEIGREFARFLALCQDGPPEQASLAAFCEELRPGDPPDGQRYLRQAFRRYAEALAEPDAKRRCELMLLANIEIGFHEQTRLQPEIVEALDAPLPNLGQLQRRLLDALRARPGASLDDGQELDLGEARAHLAAEARRLARLTITEHMMTLRLSGDRLLYLGQDLRASYPPNLQKIANPDLCALLQQVDPTPDSMRETGAVDWGDLVDRIHFIADMFRAYEEDGGLLGPPFDEAQVVALKAGRRPDGRL